MAADFEVLGSYETVQPTTPSSAVDVVRITFRTIPSGVVAYANAPNTGLVGIKPGDVGAIASRFIGPLAAGIERLMGSGQVAAAVADEDTNAAGLLIDYLLVTVSFTPDDGAARGPFEQAVRVPIYAFDEPSFYGPLIGGPINEAYQAMQALAAV